MRVFFDGALMDVDDARIEPTDRGLTLGDGLYETIAVRDGRPRRVEAHMARLRAGAQEIGLTLSPDDDALSDALDAVARANDLESGVLRLTLTRGPAPRGIKPPADMRPTLLITGSARDLPGSDPVTAVIAKGTRRNEHSPLSRIKHTNCLDAILAAREAAERGADEAILRNTAGNLAEATVANLFLVIGGAVVTPSVEDGALPGVMRADVIRELAADERTLVPGALAEASEAFLTNSLGVRPVLSIDGAAVGGGEAGPLTRKAQKIV